MKRLLVITFLVAAALVAGGVLAYRAQSARQQDASRPSHAVVAATVSRLMDCLHSHGAPDFPPPTYDGQGYPVWPDSDVARQLPDSAVQACTPIYNQLPQRPQEHGPTQAEMQTARQFSQCMRDHGFATWPDPNADGSYPLPQSIISEGKSPRFLDAVNNSCKRYLPSGHFTVSGGNGR